MANFKFNVKFRLLTPRPSGTAKRPLVQSVKEIGQSEALGEPAFPMSQPADVSHDDRIRESSVPVELLACPPRRLRFNPLCGKKSPMFWQKLMLLNPILWLALVMLWVLTCDTDISDHGVEVPGKIIALGPVYQRKGIDKREVSYQFECNGSEVKVKRLVSDARATQLKVKGKILIRALPDHSRTHLANFFPGLLSMDEAIAAAIRRDTVLCLKYWFLLLVFESVIWCEPLWQLRIVRHGSAVLGKVIGKEARRRRHGATHYYLSYSYQDFCAGIPEVKEGRMRVTRTKFEETRVGDDRTIVYLPGRNTNLLYSYAYYRAV